MPEIVSGVIGNFSSEPPGSGLPGFVLGVVSHSGVSHSGVPVVDLHGGLGNDGELVDEFISASLGVVESLVVVLPVSEELDNLVDLVGVFLDKFRGKCAYFRSGPVVLRVLNIYVAQDLLSVSNGRRESSLALSLCVFGLSKSNVLPVPHSVQQLSVVAVH